MQTVIQLNKDTKPDQISITEQEKSKNISLPSHISSEDLMGLSWIFLEDDFANPIKVSC